MCKHLRLPSEGFSLQFAAEGFTREAGVQRVAEAEEYGAGGEAEEFLCTRWWIIGPGHWRSLPSPKVTEKIFCLILRYVAIALFVFFSLDNSLPLNDLFSPDSVNLEMLCRNESLA